MRHARTVRITLSRSAPERLMKRKRIGCGIRTVILRRILPRFSLTVHITRIRPPDSLRNGKHLSHGNFGLSGIVKREYLLRHVLRLVYLFVETIRDEVRLFLHHDAHRDARQSLSEGGHFGQRLAIPAPEISFVDEISMADDQKAAVLAGSLDVLKSVVQLLDVNSRYRANL